MHQIDLAVWVSGLDSPQLNPLLVEITRRSGYRQMNTCCVGGSWSSALQSIVERSRPLEDVPDVAGISSEPSGDHHLLHTSLVEADHLGHLGCGHPGIPDLDAMPPEHTYGGAASQTVAFSQLCRRAYEVVTGSPADSVAASASNRETGFSVPSPVRVDQKSASLFDSPLR